MAVLLFAYVCMLTAFETLSLLQNLVNKESESESESEIILMYKVSLTYLCL